MKHLTTYELFESLESGNFYELFGTMVYIDNIDIFGAQYRITLLKTDGKERIYVGSKQDTVEDFKETDKSFNIRRFNMKVKKLDNSKYNIVYYVGNKKVETISMNLKKSLAYSLRGKLMKDIKYKLGKLKVEKNK